MQYNTQRSTVILREYGRNIQKLVHYIMSVEDKYNRTTLAKKLIELMKDINPTTSQHESDQRFWDHLMIMAEYKLDIDYPPNIEPCTPKAQTSIDRMTYKNSRIRLRQYGMNIELLIQESLKIENKANQEIAFIKIGRLIKYFHSIWNRDMQVEDKFIINHILKMTNDKIDLTKALYNNPKIFQITTPNGKEKRRKR